MAAQQGEIVLWIGMNANNEIVRIESGNREAVVFRTLPAQEVTVPFSAIASLGGCQPGCLFCYCSGGRLICVCRC